MLDIFAQFATDETLENNGTWVELGEAKFLIARSGNRKYAKLLSKAVERNQKTLDLKNDAADKLSEQIMIDVIAEAILLGWEDVGFKGQALTYSIDNAKLLLSVKDFRAQIMKLAEDAEAFKVKEEVDQAKN